MTQAKFLGLSQNATSFWQFVVLVQKTNSLLKGTVLHKDPCAVHERIEGGMDQVLFKQCVEEKVNKITHDDKAEELRLWMDEVKGIDDKMRSYREDAMHEFEARSYAKEMRSETMTITLRTLPVAQTPFPPTGLHCPHRKNARTHQILPMPSIPCLGIMKVVSNVIAHSRGSVRLRLEPITPLLPKPRLTWRRRPTALALMLMSLPPPSPKVS